MKKILPLLAFLVMPLSSHAVSVIIQNPGFEDQGDTLNGNGNGTPIASDPGDFTSGEVPEWNDNFPGSPNAGLFNPLGQSGPGSAHGGALVAFLNPGGYLVQDLELAGGASVTAVPLSNITISGWIANRLSAPASMLRVSLRVLPNTNIPGVSPANPLDIDPPDNTTWTQWSASFDLPDAATLGAAADQPLFLVFDGIGSQVLIDDISGTTTIPEPSTSLILGLGAASLLLRRRRS